MLNPGLTMQQIDISEAKIHLARLLEAAIKGAEIVITENGQPLVKIARVGISVSNPEVSEIDVISVTADLLNDHLPDRFCAGAPEFDRERSLWLVPVLLSYPKIGILGQVGQVAVSATPTCRYCLLYSHRRNESGRLSSR